jgi:Transcriptional regulators
MINLYNSTQKKPHTYAGELVLYPAQAHMIEIIGSSPGIHLSEIADEYLITKGAVSQTISFLFKKGLILKKPSEKGGRSVGLFLSDLGKTVLEQHRALHRCMTDEVSRLAKGLSPEALDILTQIADVIEKNIRNMKS